MFHLRRIPEMIFCFFYYKAEKTHIDKNEKLCYTYDILNKVTARSFTYDIVFCCNDRGLHYDYFKTF